MTVLTEVSLILALTLGNALFSGAEIAILAVRKTRASELVKEKRPAALALADLRRQPERFLATVQIGITLVSATAAAIGGHSLASALAGAARRVGVPSSVAEEVGLAAEIGFVAFLSIVAGELIPKSLALRSAERYALAAARPLRLLSRVASPLVWLLAACSNAVLRFFHDTTSFTEARLSKAELQQLVDEAETVGVIDRRTGDIAYRALDFGDVRAVSVMVPRAEMMTIPRGADRDSLRQAVLAGRHRRFPVTGADHALAGYVTAHDLVGLLLGPGDRTVDDVLRPALFVPEHRRAADVLADMQRTRDHLALVVDEYGTVIGLVTLEDLLEELVGEIFAEHETRLERIRIEDDGSALVAGNVPVHEINRELGLDLPLSPNYVTLGGLALELAGRLPPAGARIDAGGTTTLEVVEVVHRRISRLRLIRRTRS